MLRTLVGIGGAALLAFPLFIFSIFGLGLPLSGLFANLLVVGMEFRYGLGAGSFAWVSIFAIAPLSGIYYPVSTCLTGCSQFRGYCHPVTYSKVCGS
jgi:ABC-2 type transport system permease protein